jgi:hypothetical protein
MLDQMPRNALAVKYGRFVSCDPFDTTNNLNDAVANKLAHVVYLRRMHENVADERVICFLSLVFRHSNQIDITERILMSLASDGCADSLPPLGKKFWIETQKRRIFLLES